MKPTSPAHKGQQDRHASSSHTDHPTAGGHAHHGPPATGGREHAGAHDRHQGHSVEIVWDRFWMTLLLTIPTLVWSDMVQAWVRFSAPTFPGSVYIPPTFGTAVYLYGGWVFLAGQSSQGIGSCFLRWDASWHPGRAKRRCGFTPRSGKIPVRIR